MKSLTIVLIGLSLAITANAEEAQRQGDLGRRAPSIRKETIAHAASSGSTIQENIATNVSIPAKQSMKFVVPDDFTGAERVSMSITTFADDPNSSLKNVRIGMTWAQYGGYYIITDVILGSTFYYIDHGGANTPVYGPGLQVVVYNDATTPLNITQLSIYAYVH